MSVVNQSEQSTFSYGKVKVNGIEKTIRNWWNSQNQHLMMVQKRRQFQVKVIYYWWNWKSNPTLRRHLQVTTGGTVKRVDKNGTPIQLSIPQLLSRLHLLQRLNQKVRKGQPQSEHQHLKAESGAINGKEIPVEIDETKVLSWRWYNIVIPGEGTYTIDEAESYFTPEPEFAAEQPGVTG